MSRTVILGNILGLQVVNAIEYETDQEAADAFEGNLDDAFGTVSEMHDLIIMSKAIRGTANALGGNVYVLIHYTDGGEARCVPYRDSRIING